MTSSQKPDTSSKKPDTSSKKLAIPGKKSVRSGMLAASANSFAPSSKKSVSSSKRLNTSGNAFMTSGAEPVNPSTEAGGGYAVGYGKPPLHTRFRKGQSGNPSGRRKRAAPPARRLKALALEEAYRTVTVADAAGGVAMPAIQAIMRRQIALAMNGNGAAQRAVIAAVEAIENEQERTAAEQSAGERHGASPYGEMSDTEAARRVAFLLRLTAAQDAEFSAELTPALRPTREPSSPGREAADPPEGEGRGR